MNRSDGTQELDGHAQSGTGGPELVAPPPIASGTPHRRSPGSTLIACWGWPHSWGSVASNCSNFVWIWSELACMALKMCRVAAKGFEGAVAAQLQISPTRLRILCCSTEIKLHLSWWMLRVDHKIWWAQMERISALIPLCEASRRNPHN